MGLMGLMGLMIVSWVFVSFVVSWMEEITAEAQRPRRDAKEEGVSEFRSFGGAAKR
jgi:hypothetical protein